MILNKTSLRADKIANLYRAATYLARGDQASALNFLNQSSSPKMVQSLKLKLSQNRQLLLAEKILDQYHQTLFS